MGFWAARREARAAGPRRTLRGLPLCAPARRYTAGALEGEHDRARDEDRRVRSNDEPDQEGEGESVDDGAPEEIERQDHEDRRARRQHRTGQRLVDALVDDDGEG